MNKKNKKKEQIKVFVHFLKEKLCLRCFIYKKDCNNKGTKEQKGKQNKNNFSFEKYKSEKSKQNNFFPKVKKYKNNILH